MLQLILFWGPLQAKPKQAQEPPARTETPTNLFRRESPPGTDTLRQHQQTPSDGGKAKPISANSHASSPSENKALRSRVWARRQLCPEPFALAQEDETMQVNVKHRSTGKLLSRLTWPLDCQAQSSALPVRGFLDILTVSLRGVLPLYPKLEGD